MAQSAMEARVEQLESNPAVRHVVDNPPEERLALAETLVQSGFVNVSIHPISAEGDIRVSDDGLSFRPDRVDGFEIDEIVHNGPLVHVKFRPE